MKYGDDILVESGSILVTTVDQFYVTIYNYVISEEIRSSVEFQKHNLLTLNPVRNNFNLIMCKNVLLHFNKNERIKVIQMFYDALDSGGYFITEQTQKMPREVAGLFEQVTSNTQLFRKKIIHENC